jgi:hypothetical protein
VTVEPGVDVTPGSVIMVTPFGNLRDRAFWVTRNVSDDTFTIRVSGTRNRATPFSWLIVENDVLATGAQTDSEADEEDASTE